MKHLYILVLTIIPLLGYTQCPTSSITLSSQADVDNFTTNYPGCTDLTNTFDNPTLTISGADITDLSPLSSIQYVRGLSIYNNPMLTTLDGLNLLEIWAEGNFSMEISNNTNLTSISALNSAQFLNWNGSTSDGYIYIINNPQLISLNGLDGLITFYDFIINDNSSLTNLEGLENVNMILGFISINNNPQLINLTGLASLQYVEHLIVVNNQSLVNFNGMGSFQASKLEIRDNASLQNLAGLENFSGGGAIWLENNQLLNDISAISSAVFDELGGGYEHLIKNNPNLSVCNVPSICQSVNEQLSYLAWGGQPIIQNNAVGCMDNLEVFTNCGNAPLYDDCNEQMSLLPLGQTIQAVNEFATTSAQTPSCNDVANRADVWFKFNYQNPLTIDIIVEAGYNIQLWRGSCASMTQVPNACGATALYDISINDQTNYYVQVWSSDNGRYTNLATVPFDITVQDATLSTQEHQTESVSVYPNPTSGQLHFTSHQNVELMQVHNMLGQMVLSTRPNKMEGSIEMGDLASGLYLVKVKTTETISTMKILKE